MSGCEPDYQELSAFSANQQLQAVILTPAGTNRPQVYNPKEKKFEPVMEAGLARQIPFLPLPGNMGFIPSTEFRNGEKTEGHPLPVMVLGESIPTGTVQEVLPIGTLMLDVDGELEPIIIGVPARPSEQVIRATDYASLNQNYPAVKIILQTWLLHYQPEKNVRLSGWKDEKYTERFIRRWLK